MSKRYYFLLAQFTLFSAAAFAANLLSFLEECDPLPCPVDCTLTFPNATGCPKCDCPMGERCPLVNCSATAMNCRPSRKLDGCPTCVCDRQVFSVLDKRRNEETFSLYNFPPGATEVCRSQDMPLIDRCLSNSKQFMVQARRADPGVNSGYAPWFHFTEALLEEMCDLIEKVPACLRSARYERCKYQEPRLQYLMTVFEYPCMNHRERFFKQFTCMRNMMIGHYRMERCQKSLEKSLHLAEKGKFEVTEKLRTKCGALNDFVSCSLKPLEDYCGQEAATVFSGVIMAGTAQLSPECQVINGRFREIIIKGTFDPKREWVSLTSTQRLPISRRVDTSFTSNIRALPAPAGVPTPGVAQSIDPTRRTRFYSRPASHNLEVSAQRRPQRRRDTVLVAVSNNDGHVSFTDHRDNSVKVDGGRLSNVLNIIHKCARVATRAKCPDGGNPQRVTRWYRKFGVNECIPYQYGYCGRTTEKREMPMKYELDCYKYCFHNANPMHDMVFENGFRIDDDKNV